MGSDTTTQGASPEVEREQDLFEAAFPIPANCTRFPGGYAATEFNAWAAHTFCERWEGWKAARRANAPAPQGPSDARFLGHIRDDGVFSRSPVERRPGDVWTEAWSAPQPPAALVPLTPERIEAIWVEHGLDDCDPEGFARRIEADHGISGAPDGHQQT